MILFLTSSPSGCPFEPGPEIPVLDESNGFVANLRAVWPQKAPLGLAIASDPEAHEQLDQMCGVFSQSFANAGLPLADFIPCDYSNESEIGELVSRAGFIMLSGGHVPTQNRFFERIGLAELLRGYTGIVMGVSAGSMNSARVVYAQPEEEGEAVDPGYSRWLSGLGLTETRVLPHYQFTRGRWLDGQRIEDISLADSRELPFYAIPDGSYILSADGAETLYGKAWYVHDGMIEQVNDDGGALRLV